MAGGRFWTPEEVAAIRTLPAGGLAELARKLGRTRTAVSQKRAKLGIQIDQRWTPAERAAFHARVRTGERVDVAAASIGRTAHAGYHRRRCDRDAGRDVPPAPPR